MITWANRWQIPLYLTGILAGAAVGILLPSATPVFTALVNPTLIVLLFATFLAVPFVEIGRAARDVRFLAAILLLNFALVPALVFGLSRFVAHDRAILVGVLLVLLAPCIDYVVVFTRIAGGAASRLLAVSPVVMLVQLALLPVFIGLMAGPDVIDGIDIAPFTSAFGLFVVLPMGLAALTQALGRRVAVARMVERSMDAAMVPILAVIVAAHVGTVRDHVSALLGVLPVYVAFLVAAPLLGVVVSRLFRQDAATARATVFSGSTRNSLVVLPLALALPQPLAAASAAVVAQTVVELIGMIVLVRVVPRLIPR